MPFQSSSSRANRCSQANRLVARSVAHRVCRAASAVVFGALLTGVGACGGGPESEVSDVRVDTERDLAWKQHQANVAFAREYVPQCTPTATGRPRVIVSGFGRFLSNPENATGRMVTRLIEGMVYPLTERPPVGEIDPAGPQTSVSQGVLELPLTGEVDVCAMVLPVFWDLASVLVLKEVQAFQPDFVFMNGIANARQPLWIELGAVNRAVGSPDGSGILRAEAGSPLIEDLSVEDQVRGSLLSWHAVAEAASAVIADRAEAIDDSASASPVALQARMDDVVFKTFPRSSNTYLCNNTTFTVGYFMDHPGETHRLMEASHPRDDGDAFYDYVLAGDHRDVPRVFIHWPSTLSGNHLDTGADVMRAIIDAQLNPTCGDSCELPSRGDASLGQP